MQTRSKLRRFVHRNTKLEIPKHVVCECEVHIIFNTCITYYLYIMLLSVYYVVSITVTHVVTPVDKGCCPRTLKYLYAVAAAKWIVSYNCKL